MNKTLHKIAKENNNKFDKSFSIEPRSDKHNCRKKNSVSARVCIAMGFKGVGERYRTKSLLRVGGVGAGLQEGDLFR